MSVRFGADTEAVLEFAQSTKTLENQQARATTWGYASQGIANEYADGVYSHPQLHMRGTGGRRKAVEESPHTAHAGLSKHRHATPFADLEGPWNALAPHRAQQLRSHEHLSVTLRHDHHRHE